MFKILMTDRFVGDLSEIANWIYTTNLEQSESLAEKKLLDLEGDLNHLNAMLAQFPETGYPDEFVVGVRKFPIYNGRYSAQWITDSEKKTVTLLSISDLKYPKELRNVQTED